MDGCFFFSNEFKQLFQELQGISGTGDLKKQQKKTGSFGVVHFVLGDLASLVKKTLTKPNLYGNLIGISKSGTLEF